MATGHSSAGALLTAMLEDRLFIKEDQTVVIARSIDESLTAFELLDPVSLRAVGSASPDALTKIGTNNRLRRFLRTTVARFALASPDPTVRLAAVKDMMRTLDDATVELLRARAGVENDDAVAREIETALALAALDGEDASGRLRAVTTLSDRFSTEVRNRLAVLIEPGLDGSFSESDPAVRAAATAAVQSIDSTRRMYSASRRSFSDSASARCWCLPRRDSRSPSGSWASSTWRTAK